MEPPKPLDYASPATEETGRRNRRDPPGWVPAGLTILQVFWLIPSAYVQLAVGCETQGRPPVPMLFATCFTALPAIGAVLAVVGLPPRGRFAWRARATLSHSSSAAGGSFTSPAGGSTGPSRIAYDLYCP